MKDLKHPAKPLFRSESDVDVTIHSDEESDIEGEEDYHRSKPGVCLKFFSECLLRNFLKLDEKNEQFLERYFVKKITAGRIQQSAHSPRSFALIGRIDHWSHKIINSISLCIPCPFFQDYTHFSSIILH